MLSTYMLLCTRMVHVYKNSMVSDTVSTFTDKSLLWQDFFARVIKMRARASPKAFISAWGFGRCSLDFIRTVAIFGYLLLSDRNLELIRSLGDLVEYEHRYPTSTPSTTSQKRRDGKPLFCLTTVMKLGLFSSVIRADYLFCYEKVQCLRRFDRFIWLILTHSVIEMPFVTDLYEDALKNDENG